VAEVVRATLDTSILIRHLTGDDPGKAARVRGLLARAAQGEIDLLVPPVVIAELAWVLESYFRLRRGEIAELPEAVLATPGLTIPERPVLAEAVTAFRDSGVDFTDAWIAAVARAQGYTTVFTFDRRHFARLEGIQPEAP
jgi:predicted nucleic acid-binding protein